MLPGKAGKVIRWQSGGQVGVAMGPRGKEQLKVLGNTSLEGGARRPGR